MAEVEAGVAAPVVETPVAAEATIPPESTAEPGKEEKKPERIFTQEEVDEIVQKRLTKESRRAERVGRERARAEAAEAETVRLRAELDARKNPQPQQGKPSLKDYENDPEAYLEAMTEWKLAERESKRSKEIQDARAREDSAADVGSIIEAVTEGSDEFEDFQEVAFNPRLPITGRMAQAITESAAPAKVLYHLGQNVAEASRISKLAPREQAKEIEAIESKLTAPAQTTKAPPPIKPSSGSGVAEKDPGSMTDKEFREWRKRQIAQRR